jgi:hypothetical protein
MIKEKKWYWWLTIFATPIVTTTISPHIYVSQGYKDLSKKGKDIIIKHENIHLQQQEEVGLWKYLFLYCFCLPILWNPWRYEWEYKAYTKTGTSKKQTEEYLSSHYYGWLQ